MAIIAKGTIYHNGQMYEPGEEIPGLKKEEAKRLLELGVAEEQKASAKAEKDTEQ
ncbi:hypothetical protein WJ0W_003278 [Paenibacillus melissococcoides]|uniref:DUF7210 domain-containing protein n=1 Tax=Paenibacillus melissococcoides TaxID=2912268 RepID=A0ABM9G4E1_9BACL|nr:MULTISPECIES: hypothetical protein [Paenibacillus]MEB9893286.1 hypothetical protein [Bacillus cereus]CAH8246041.1 hypothetical protein WJ0W_003278 [Paenibacillus melissococcoides]CAH8712797.1 hypothetical protein WDD9_003357 [Paenibacillus melissococcoides]CAH8713566.1 hypothetical protein HTL2_003660 [Paenibacillus melissococcoides]GIO78765.1 hypothetical protein J6TS7_23750 [Paenibacillus dendritiformis]